MSFIMWNPKLKDVIPLIICGVLGVVSGGIMFSKDTVTEKIVEKPVEKKIIQTKEVCSQEEKWKELKAVDDEVISLSTQAIFIASDSFMAISRLDTATVEKNNEKINALTPQMEVKAARRKAILKELGY
jgi:hypothetical protein